MTVSCVVSNQTRFLFNISHFFPDIFQASRAQILKKAAEYIQFMRRKNSSHQQDIDDLKRQNNLLEAQIRTLERARTTGNFDAAELGLAAVKSESESSEEGEEGAGGVAGANRRSKKLKPNTYVG